MIQDGDFRNRSAKSSPRLMSYWPVTAALPNCRFTFDQTSSFRLSSGKYGVTKNSST